MHAVPELLSPSNVPAAQAVHVDVVSVNDPTSQSAQVFVAMDDGEASAMKVPSAQLVHTGCAVVDPTVFVYFPATQLV